MVEPTRERCYNYSRTKRLIQGAVALSPNRNFSSEIMCISNSPLCNSSPRASTVVLERITKRYFGSSEPQCLCVSWLQLKMDMCRDAEENAQAWTLSTDVSGRMRV